MNAKSHEIIYGIRKIVLKNYSKHNSKKIENSKSEFILWETNLSKCTNRTYIAAVAGVILSGGSNFDLNRWLFVEDFCIHKNEFFHDKHSNLLATIREN